MRYYDIERKYFKDTSHIQEITCEKNDFNLISDFEDEISNRTRENIVLGTTDSPSMLLSIEKLNLIAV